MRSDGEFAAREFILGIGAGRGGGAARKIKRYGFRREKAEADCSDRITYLYDAQDMTPAKMTYDEDTGVGTFDYGDWEPFVNKVARPVMLKTDGTVDYALDRDDQTKKLDGTASDITNTSYDGNFMVEFGKEFRWVKRYEDEDYEYVIFSNVQYDSSYHAYAHTNDAGEIKDAFYIGAKLTTVLNNIGRSIVNGTNACTRSLNRETEITRAKANGNGYNILYKSAWDYISDLLTLISKTDDSQTAFGTGVDSRQNAIRANSWHNDAGPFYGTNDGKIPVKVFWIQDYWGNAWQSMAGCINDKGNVKVRMTGPYCDKPVTSPDYSNYRSTGITPAGTSGNTTKDSSTTDEYGYIGKTASGSASTYIPDTLYFKNGQVDFAIVGAGYYTDAGRAGSRCLALADLATSTLADRGSRLSYIPA